MHSSRMRTDRSLTVCRSLFPGGCASGGCASQGGVCFPGGGVFPGVCFAEGCMPLGGGGIPACTEADTPRWTESHTSKNITLATTLLRPVKNAFQ